MTQILMPWVLFPHKSQVPVHRVVTLDAAGPPHVPDWCAPWLSRPPGQPASPRTPLTPAAVPLGGRAKEVLAGYFWCRIVFLFPQGRAGVHSVNRFNLSRHPSPGPHYGSSSSCALLETRLAPAQFNSVQSLTDCQPAGAEFTVH